MSHPDKPYRSEEISPGVSGGTARQQGQINQGLVALPPVFSFEFLGDTNTCGKRDGPS